MSGEKIGYFAKQVAEDLDITKSTLRRWSVELEKQGYHFEKNEKNQRIYYERDYRSLRELKSLIGHSVPFVSAINTVIASTESPESAILAHSVHEDEVRLSKRELQELIHEEVYKAVEEEREAMFKAFENKMNHVVEKRDRLLTQQLQKSLEEQQLKIAASAEEEKKPWWKKIFGG